MRHPVQFDMRSMLVWVTIIAALLGAWQTASHFGICAASLLLGVFLFSFSCTRSSLVMFAIATVLIGSYLVMLGTYALTTY